MIEAESLELKLGLLRPDEDELKVLVRNLFSLLDCKEESESGAVFSPTSISSCRTHHVELLNSILPRMRVLVGLPAKGNKLWRTLQ